MVINGHHQLRVKVENQDMFHGACPNLRCTFRVVESAPTRHCHLVSGAVGLRATARVRCGGQTSHLEGNFLRMWQITSDDGICLMVLGTEKTKLDWASLLGLGQAYFQQLPRSW